MATDPEAMGGRGNNSALADGSGSVLIAKARRRGNGRPEVLREGNSRQRRRGHGRTVGDDLEADDCGCDRLGGSGSSHSKGLKAETRQTGGDLVIAAARGGSGPSPRDLMKCRWTMINQLDQLCS
ncbi:hypothetical protein TRIUR3_34244 [Triticum urartu]|uniref:Uncharacterized protein n=1 Tax=Triticum urartu TaxID=4572 RepID=M7Z777_TRIUA|nr:hypothetical protein TRIUR3_34244 [Triticum urartu]